MRTLISELFVLHTVCFIYNIHILLKRKYNRFDEYLRGCFSLPPRQPQLIWFSAISWITIFNKLTNSCLRHKYCTDQSFCLRFCLLSTKWTDFRPFLNWKQRLEMLSLSYWCILLLQRLWPYSYFIDTAQIWQGYKHAKYQRSSVAHAHTVIRSVSKTLVIGHGTDFIVYQ